MCGGRRYELRAGQGFVIFPHTPALYRADENTPWSYSWIGFDGEDLVRTFRSWGLGPDNPVLNFDDSCRAFYYLDEIMETKRDTPGSEWRILGTLMKVIGEVERFSADGRSPDQDDHVRRALLFIERNYTRPIAVADVVDHICLERSYFSHLFKEKTGESPRDYLRRYRIDKAMELLMTTSYSIDIVARSVGFRDPLHFSRVFKKLTGRTASEFRKIC